MQFFVGQQVAIGGYRDVFHAILLAQLHELEQVLRYGRFCTAAYLQAEGTWKQRFRNGYKVVGAELSPHFLCGFGIAEVAHLTAKVARHHRVDVDTEVSSLAYMEC